MLKQFQKRTNNRRQTFKKPLTLRPRRLVTVSTRSPGFVDDEDVLQIIEGLVVEIFDRSLDIKIGPKLPRLNYKEVINRYGVDKPDTRFGLELVDVGDIFSQCEFKVFLNILKDGGLIK